MSKTYTPQTAYEKIVEWFSRPGAVYGMGSSGCQYRANQHPDSLIRCAVGCLITPKQYEVLIEKGNPEGEGPSDIVHLLNLGGQDLENFLENAQTVHDNCATGDWASILVNGKHVFDVVSNDGEAVPLSTFLDYMDELAEAHGLAVA